MIFVNYSFYVDNSTKNWQPQPTPMEDRRRRHTGKWVTAILILGLLALWGLAFLFVYCTFHPPELGLWQDPVTLGYGLPK